MREELDWQAPKKATPQKLARVQRATWNPIPECASQSLYIDPQMKTGSEVARCPWGSWSREAEAACSPLHWASPPLPTPACPKQKLGEGGKERRGDRAMGREGGGQPHASQCWSAFLESTQSDLDAQAACLGPTQSKVTPTPRNGLSSFLLLLHSVKAPGDTLCLLRATVTHSVFASPAQRVLLPQAGWS